MSSDVRIIRVEAIGKDGVVLQVADGQRFTLCEGDTLTLSDIRVTLSEA